MTDIRHRLCAALLLAAAAAPATRANPVDPDAALAVARRHLARPVHTPLAQNTVRTLGGDTRETPAYYIFNDAGGEGFCLVAGDDRLGSVLGYSDTGRIDPANLPPGLRTLLTGYERAANAVRVDSLALTPAYPNPPKAYVKPLVSCTWNQYYPYNMYTPVLDGTHTPTGCTATAMAQVLYSHKWPKERPASLPRGDSGAYALDSYDWDSMVDNYESGGYSTAAGEAVATLMRDVGRAVKMTYGKEGSQASEFEAWYALENTYGYSVRELEKDRLRGGVFLEAVYNELSEGNAILMYGGDHAFIFDGYDANGLVHANWGWGGLDDGYFDINKAAVSSGGYNSDGNYYEKLRALFVRPRDGQHEPFDEQPVLLWMVNGGSLNILESETTAGGCLTAELKGVGGRNMVKGTYGAYRGEVGVGLFDGEGECLHVFKYPNELQWYSIYGSWNIDTGWTLDFTDAPALADGRYTLRPLGHRRLDETGDAWEDSWKLMADANRVFLDKAGDRITVTPEPAKPALRLVGEPQVLAPFYQYGSSEWAMVFDVANDTRHEARGNLSLSFRGTGELEGETFTVPSYITPNFVAQRNDTTRWLVKFYSGYTGTGGSCDMLAGRYAPELSLACDDATYDIAMPGGYTVEVLPNGYKTRLGVTRVAVFDGEEEAERLYFDPRRTERIGLAAATRAEYISGGSLSTRLRYRLLNLSTGADDYTSPSLAVTLPYGESGLLTASRHDVPLSALTPGCAYEVHVDLQREGEWLDLWNAESLRRRVTILSHGSATALTPPCRTAACGEGGNSADAPVYTLQGVRAAGPLDGLPPGVYLVGGKKMVRK